MSQRYDPGQALISIHVPRTGGNSVRMCLENWFGPRGFYTHYVDEAVGGAPERHVLGPGNCVHGHFNKYRGYGVRDYYPECRQWIIFLRDPFEQHVSLFFYLRRNEGMQFFSGRAVPGSAWKGFGDFLQFMSDNRDVLQTSFANTFLAHLPVDHERASADEILSQFIHVGITEELGASLRLLAAKLERSELEMPRVNSAERDLVVDERLRERHEEMFAVEHAIFGAARARHAREIVSSSGSI
ncbi:MAG TPA: hypothetical protein VG722_00505 [Tepidisphaeraceae bacterium]|nr:hypothetical protein [Tepidisphaeraceae bacterium]